MTVLRAFVFAVALGYVMPAYSIFKRVAAQRDELTLNALKIDGLGAAGPSAARELAQALGTAPSPGGEVSLTASMSIRFPSRCRLELSSNESTKSLAVVWANGKKRAEGPAFAAAQVAVDQACALLALRSGSDGETRASIEKHLSSLKVDTKQVALGRFSGTTAFVIGDRSKSGASQFWVYKERFLPARVKYTDEPGTPWDVRFIDYTSQATSEWFPRVIEVYKGEELQLRFSGLSADTRPTLDNAKF